VIVVSTNKLLGLGDHDAQKVFFPGCDKNYEQNIDEYTCALLISQSGQTFPSLHALQKLTHFVKDKCWILTGAFHSKMETALVKSFTEHGLVYMRDRVFNNYAGKRPAEPSTVAVAATWHTLSHILLCLVETVQDRHSKRCLSYAWENDLEERARVVAPESSHKAIGRMSSVLEENVDEEDLGGGEGGGEGRRRGSSAVENKTHQIMSMTRGCIRDYRSLITGDALVRNMSDIVGYSADKKRLPYSTVHDRLETQGRAWAAHINEPWHALVASGVYIFISVTFGVPLFTILAVAVVAVLEGTGVDLGAGYVAFSLLAPSNFMNQSAPWIVFAIVIQFLDAMLYVYLGKIVAKCARSIYGRPIDARLGKRSLVIVDTPCVHQMLENYVSKLFSMSYSFVSLDVHGASGLDHFVHRFTHRVSRGVMIAVGRPDGRLCCLSKGESSILLSIKQATFIRNPQYKRDGSGPDIVSVGHNPFVPNLGLATYMVS
jgi:hypothetical protein